MAISRQQTEKDFRDTLTMLLDGNEFLPPAHSQTLLLATLCGYMNVGLDDPLWQRINQLPTTIPAYNPTKETP